MLLNFVLATIPGVFLEVIPDTRSIWRGCCKLFVPEFISEI